MLRTRGEVEMGVRDGLGYINIFCVFSLMSFVSLNPTQPPCGAALGACE